MELPSKAKPALYEADHGVLDAGECDWYHDLEPVLTLTCMHPHICAGAYKVARICAHVHVGAHTVACVPAYVRVRARV